MSWHSPLASGAAWLPLALTRVTEEAGMNPGSWENRTAGMKSAQLSESARRRAAARSTVSCGASSRWWSIYPGDRRSGAFQPHLPMQREAVSDLQSRTLARTFPRPIHCGCLLLWAKRFRRLLMLRGACAAWNPVCVDRWVMRAFPGGLVRGSALCAGPVMCLYLYI